MTTTFRVDLRDRNQLTLPAEVRAALHVGAGDMIEFTIDETGDDVRVRGLTAIPADQAWYWTPEWQAGEREVDEAIAAGKLTRFETDEEFDAWLASH